MSDSEKILANKVYGVNIGFGQKHKIFVLKFDLGNHRRTFHLHEQSALWLFGNLTTPNGTLLGELPTIPPIHDEDWDGDWTPSITGLQVNEFDNGIILTVTLDRGEPMTLMLNLPVWHVFSHGFWQYQPYFSQNLE